MQQQNLVLLGWVVSVLLPPASALRSGGQAESKVPQATIGQAVPDFTFRDFLAGGDGRQKLSDFRGQPVLVVNWTDTDFGRGAAGEVEKLAQELVPEGLVLVLLDTHNKPAAEIEASVMRLYPGSPARLQQNQELPIEYLDNGPPPDIALIGLDGTLLVAGSYTVDLNKAEKLIQSELKKRKSGWGEDDVARAARALAFGKRRLAEASAAIAAARASGASNAELDAVQAELANLRDTWVGSVRYFREQGLMLRGLEEARALAQAVQGAAEWEAQATALLAEFEGAEAERELELDRKLASLLAPLSRKAPDREGEKLRKFAAQAAGSRVGRRALHLAEVAELAAKQ